MPARLVKGARLSGQLMAVASPYVCSGMVWYGMVMHIGPVLMYGKVWHGNAQYASPYLWYGMVW